LGYLCHQVTLTLEHSGFSQQEPRERDLPESDDDGGGLGAGGDEGDDEEEDEEGDEGVAGSVTLPRQSVSVLVQVRLHDDELQLVDLQRTHMNTS